MTVSLRWPSGLVTVQILAKQQNLLILPARAWAMALLLLPVISIVKKGAIGNIRIFSLMLPKLINFEKTPMAVVTCTNAGTAAPNAGDAPGAGWATGGGRTYKFNLTSGVVNKGD